MLYFPEAEIELCDIVDEIMLFLSSFVIYFFFFLQNRICILKDDFAYFVSKLLSL